MSSIFETQYTKNQLVVIDQLRSFLSKSGFGFTIQGNRLTLRWNSTQIHLAILEITTQEENKTIANISKIEEEYMEKHIPEEKLQEMSAKIHKEEYGEWPE